MRKTFHCRCTPFTAPSLSADSRRTGRPELYMNITCGGSSCGSGRASLVDRNGKNQNESATDGNILIECGGGGCSRQTRQKICRKGIAEGWVDEWVNELCEIYRPSSIAR